MRLWLAVVMLGLFMAGNAMAIAVDETRLADPALEARAHELMREFRCLVCQNESIQDSDAPLAADLRDIVRERIQAGDTDAQVRAYLRARYGDWVLLNPPFMTRTLVLWLGPFLLLIGGAVFLWFQARRLNRDGTEATPLTVDEEKRIAALLDNKEGRQD